MIHLNPSDHNLLLFLNGVATEWEMDCMRERFYTEKERITKAQSV